MKKDQHTTKIKFCNHSFVEQQTMWSGVVDRKCRKCGYYEVGMLPQKTFNRLARKLKRKDS